jgi:hypothetical protein
LPTLALGHCQFQTSSQSDECENVQVESKSFVQTEHYKVSKTRNCETVDKSSFDQNDEVGTKLRTTPTKVWRNDSHHCHDYQISHTKSRRLGIHPLTSSWGLTCTHTQKMSVDRQSTHKAVTYHFVLVGECDRPSWWISVAGGGREMSWKEVLSATLQIIRIQ